VTGDRAPADRGPVRGRGFPVLSGPRPFAIAHRGSRLLWPENTMVAFRGATRLGIRWLETDLHLTSDGVIVCLHDDDLDRTTDASGPVWEYTSHALATVDAAFSFTREGATPHRGTGVRVPTLETVVTVFDECRFVVDLKQDGLAEPLVELVGDLGMEDRVIVGSFSDRRLDELRNRSRGRIATSTGTRETALRWATAILGLPTAPAAALQVPRRTRNLPVVNRRTVNRFHRAGAQVHVWTINHPSEMEELLDLGVDGIITDRPDVLRDVMVGRNVWTGGPDAR
jgi:glycerophosphoryl diester phosphodiesterase